MFSASTSRENLKIGAGVCPTILCLLCWLACLGRCSCIILPHLKICMGSVHELLHGMSMLLYICFCLPAGIFNWMPLPLDQIFEIFFPSGFLTHSFIQYLFHLWLLYNWHLLLPLDLWLIITFCSCFISFIWI
jgi:hypothetical protein